MTTRSPATPPTRPPATAGVRRPAGSRRVRLAAVLLVLATVATGPSAAAAYQPPPAATPTASVQGPVVAQPPADGGGFGEDQVVDRYGIPVFDYSIEARRGGGVDGTFTRLEIWLSNVLFSICRLIVVAVVWLLSFALDFTLAQLLLTPVQQLVGVYQTNFVGGIDGGGWGLVPLALMICVFWFGLAALRGRVGKGAGEILLSFTLSALLGAILANPGGTLLGEQGLVGRAKDIGVEIAVTAVQTPDTDPPPCVQRPPTRGEALVDGCHLDQHGDGAPPTRSDPQFLRWIMQMWLVDMYIRRPHQQMTYGQRLDCPLVLTIRDTDGGPADPCQLPHQQGGDHPCVDRYNQILTTSTATAPAAPGADPGSYMYDMMHPDQPVAGCPEGADLAAYLDQGSGDRLAVGLLLLVALILLAAFLIVGVLIPIIVGQAMVAVLAVALVFVLPIALLGGAARRVLWRWFGLLLAAVFLMIIALVGLALMLITTELLLQGHQRFFFLNLLMVAITSVLFLLLQRRLLAGSLAGGRRLGAAIEDIPIGGLRRGTTRITVHGGAGGLVRPPVWTRAATAGYRPYDRYRRNQQVKGDVYQQTKYAHQWKRRQQQRETPHRRLPGRWRRRTTRGGSDEP